MGTARGIIKLSHYQAEGRRSECAVLCLKYIICVVTAAAIFILWIKNYGNSNSSVFIFAAFFAAVLSIYFRTSLHYNVYRLSACYLRRKCDVHLLHPTGTQLFSGAIMLLALKCTVILFMLSPSAICLFWGMHSFSLSGEREHFILMLGASVCMFMSGIIFAAVIMARFDCAEYLFFSGKCNSVFSAVDTSWTITEGSSGDIILMKLCLIFRGISMASLSRINLSAKLAKAYFDKNSSNELCCELRQNQYGEQSVDLIILRQ